MHRKRDVSKMKKIGLAALVFACVLAAPTVFPQVGVVGTWESKKHRIELEVFWDSSYRIEHNGLPMAGTFRFIKWNTIRVEPKGAFGSMMNYLSWTFGTTPLIFDVSVNWLALSATDRRGNTLRLNRRWR